MEREGAVMTGPGAPADAQPLTPTMRTIMIGALWCLAVIVLAATATAFAESYHGLRSWALDHKVPAGWRADIWPLQVDAYILAGEIVLLVAAIRAWGLRARLLGWTLSLSGLAASVIWNAGHVGKDATSADHITAAVPPIAAVAGLMAALAVIKRLAVDPGLSRALTATPDTRAAGPLGEITLRPVTPAARSAITSALVADLTACVSEVTRAVTEIDRMTPGLTPRRLDVQTSRSSLNGHTRPAAGDSPNPRGVSLTKGGASGPLASGRPDVQTSTNGRTGPQGDPGIPESGPALLDHIISAGRTADDADRLASLPSDAARVRLVLDAFGLDLTPQQVTRYLALYGYELAPEAVRSAIRRARQAARTDAPDGPQTSAQDLVLSQGSR